MWMFVCLSSSCALAVTECILCSLEALSGLTSLGNDELEFCPSVFDFTLFYFFSLCLFPVSTFHYYSCFAFSLYFFLSFSSQTVLYSFHICNNHSYVCLVKEFTKVCCPQAVHWPSDSPGCLRTVCWCLGISVNQLHNSCDKWNWQPFKF